MAMAAFNKPQFHRNVLTTKRQIRPNVRLHEIGDLPAALLTALYFTRTDNPSKPAEEEHLAEPSPNPSCGGKRKRRTFRGLRPVEHLTRYVSSIVEEAHWEQEEEEEAMLHIETSVTKTDSYDAILADKDDRVNSIWCKEGEHFESQPENQSFVDEESWGGYGAFTNSQHQKNGAKYEQGAGMEMCGSLANDGVRGWLHSLGLEKYAPLFEIHEVDTEVLPLLTLEDLKDMEIRAVGTRRKLFSAIQQLAKGLSI